MDGVAEFVQQDIVDEARGEGHEIKTEVDGVTSRTAAPAGLRRLDAHTFVLDSVLGYLTFLLLRRIQKKF